MTFFEKVNLLFGNFANIYRNEVPVLQGDINHIFKLKSPYFDNDL